MIKLFEEQKQSIYKIQKDTGIPIAKLYRYAKGDTPINKMPVDLVLQLANYFKIEPNELVNMMLRYATRKYLK